MTEAPRVQVLPADILSHLPWPEGWVQAAGLCDGKTNCPGGNRVCGSPSSSAQGTPLGDSQENSGSCVAPHAHGSF